MSQTNGLLAGLDTAAAQTALANAQQAYIQLQTGAKAVKLRYSQGGGEQEVEYTQANMAGLANLIQMLQQQLGIVSLPRRPILPRF